MGVALNTTIIPTVLPIGGVLLLLAGAMIAGTSQVLRYDMGKKQISYDSTIALFSGYSKSFTTERLESMVYTLHKITHQREKRFNEEMLPSAMTERRRTYHTTWDGVLTLWYEGNNNVDFPKISHSESLENGIKEIASALGVPYERREFAEKRTGIL